MFGRILSTGQKVRRTNLFGNSMRFLHKDDGENNIWLPGGGLEKLQGGIKEEMYFNDHDLELLEKMRDDNSKKLKCENCAENWSEFEKVANASIETCSANKNKNCNEEAYFMKEQTENLKHLTERLKEDGSTVDDDS